MKIARKRYSLYILTLLAGGLVSLLVLAIIAYISNQNLPTGPQQDQRLEPIDQARLAEALQLQDSLGDTVWPGWGKAEIPVLLWNPQTSFLVGFENPPADWIPVAGDNFQGATYYAQPTGDSQNFAVQIGDTWVSSMATKYEADQFMQQVFRDLLPDFVEPVFPFRLLILNSEIQISAVLHESFHVFQAEQAPERFAFAQTAYATDADYWAVDPQMQADWETEIEILIEALDVSNDGDAATLAAQFLQQRQARRAAANLLPALVDYERQIEWLEGLAKYVELTIWQAAAQQPAYQPLPGMQADPDFKSYQTYDQRWKQEISQARTQANTEGDVRFYYTGLLQARLLDRLLPDWKTRIFEPDVCLEDLLLGVVSP